MSSPESSFNPDFEAQFANVETIQFGEKKLPVIDVSPTITKGKPVLFALGWNARFPDYKRAFGMMVNAGRRVISLETSGSEDEKAEEFIALLNLKGFEEVDIVAHSLGTMGVILAGFKDSRLKNFVFLNPPSDEESSSDVIRRYRAMLGFELGFEGVKSIVNVGVDKIREMSRVIKDFEAGTKLEQLRGLGAKAISIHGKDDILFRPSPTAVSLEEENIEAGHDEFVIEGNHLNIDPFIPNALRLLEQ